MSGRVHQEDETKLKATVILAAGSEIEVTQNVAADLKATVTQLAKDRTVTGTVTVEQGFSEALHATVIQGAKDRTVTGTVTVTQATAANLNAVISQAAPESLHATVYQYAVGRTVTGTVTTKEAQQLVPFEYDYIALTYTGDNLTSVVYKTGGSGGSTVATLTLAYTGAVLDTITRT